MKRYILILFIILLFLPSCGKTNDGSKNSGTATINNVLNWDNTRQTWFSYGFLFSSGKLVSILDTPSPDITVDNDGTLGDIRLLDNNFSDSFFKAGEFSSSKSAIQAFDSLMKPVVLQWVVWADSLKPNQIWLYKSGSSHYSKLRIISTDSEVRSNKNYAECTFEWVYQPDGSLTFPGK
ncbi:MAG: hypothetical protein ABSA76_01525 [Bacteroidales bacterium]